MKTCLFALCIALLCTPALAVDGKALFESKGCTSCHHPEKHGIGPSLQTVASAYGGEQGELVSFLAGHAEPRVHPERFSIMKPNLETTQALTDEEREALAEFILSHQ